MRTFVYLVVCFLSFDCLASLESLHMQQNVEKLKVQEDLSSLRDAKKREETAKAAAKAKLDAQKSAERHAQAVAKKQEADQKLKIEAQALAKIEAERLADKKREQAFEDELREIRLIKLRAQASAEAKNAERKAEAEIATIEINNTVIASEADVIQSNADANRSRAEGDKALAEKLGEAAVNLSEAEKKKNSGFFD